jgi:carboxymethylenebutenolidase
MKEHTDPTRATAPDLNRRAFVGLGAGAAALGATAVPAFAADALGKPHAPLVPEDDPALTIGRPKIVYGERTLDAYSAQPKDRTRIGGAIVVVQHVWGVDAQIRDTVRRLALEGYAVVAPDLYTGLGAPSGDGASDFTLFGPFSAKLVDDVVDKDLAASASWALHDADPARAHKPALRAGITGFCGGGGIALRQTIVNPTVFSAAAIWYGKVANSNPDAVKAPLLGSFGARDTSIPAEAVREFFSKLAVPHDVKIYDSAGHAFFDDTRAAYDPAAAADSWKRALVWFGRYLRSNGQALGTNSLR